MSISSPPIYQSALSPRTTSNELQLDPELIELAQLFKEESCCKQALAATKTKKQEIEQSLKTIESRIADVVENVQRLRPDENLFSDWQQLEKNKRECIERLQKLKQKRESLEATRKDLSERVKVSYESVLSNSLPVAEYHMPAYSPSLSSSSIDDEYSVSPPMASSSTTFVPKPPPFPPKKETSLMRSQFLEELVAPFKDTGNEEPDGIHEDLSQSLLACSSVDVAAPKESFLLTEEKQQEMVGLLKQAFDKASAFSHVAFQRVLKRYEAVAEKLKGVKRELKKLMNSELQEAEKDRQAHEQLVKMPKTLENSQFDMSSEIIERIDSYPGSVKDKFNLVEIELDFITEAVIYAQIKDVNIRESLAETRVTLKNIEAADFEELQKSLEFLKQKLIKKITLSESVQEVLKDPIKSRKVDIEIIPSFAAQDIKSLVDFEASVKAHVANLEAIDITKKDPVTNEYLLMQGAFRDSKTGKYKYRVMQSSYHTDSYKLLVSIKESIEKLGVKKAKVFKRQKV